LNKRFQRRRATVRETPDSEFKDYVSEVKRRFEITSTNHSDSLEGLRAKKGQVPSYRVDNGRRGWTKPQTGYRPWRDLRKPPISNQVDRNPFRPTLPLKLQDAFQIRNLQSDFELAFIHPRPPPTMQMATRLLCG